VYTGFNDGASARRRSLKTAGCRPCALAALDLTRAISRSESTSHAVTAAPTLCPLIHRRNRRALDHTTALARIPCRKVALAHNLDHSDAAHNLARNVFAGCRDPLRVGTHRVLQKLRGTDR